jgi:hypothetical protein
MKSKALFLLFVFIWLSRISMAQVTVEQVDFDHYISPSDNDLMRHFYGTQGLTQLPGNGITGGCLQAPDSNNWGNDNSRYCSKFSAVNDSVYAVSICFQYDATLLGAGFDRAVSVWLQPHADPNHYIIATVAHNGQTDLITYSTFTASLSPLSLQTGNWYRLTLTFQTNSSPGPFSVHFSNKVEDLGNLGTATPVLLDSIADVMLDSIFAADDAIEVSLTGARYGGAAFLDNFSFSGIKSADSCNFTGVPEYPVPGESISFQTTGDKLMISGAGLANQQALILNTSGMVVNRYGLTKNENTVDLSSLARGIYFVAVIHNNKKSTYRLVVTGP